MHLRRAAVATVAAVAALAAPGSMLGGCGSPGEGVRGAAPATHRVLDATGRPVAVPVPVERIADGWPAHNEIVQLLGGCDKLVATALRRSTTPWLYTVCPALGRAPTTFTGGTVNIEALSATRPDVVFLAAPAQSADRITALGMPTVQLIFQDFDGLKQVVATTADILGPTAVAQAGRYATYLDTRLAAVSSVTSAIPATRRPSVLHVHSLHPLVVDGTNSVVDAWIDVAGGRNAARVVGNLRTVSTEQVARWNPDVIILGATAGGAAAEGGDRMLAALRADPFWGGLGAVRGHRAYVNPAGAFLWDRYGIEEALQVQWAARTLHPDRFGDLDMLAETRNFYARFLHYRLSADQARRILAAQPPAP